VICLKRRSPYIDISGGFSFLGKRTKYLLYKILPKVEIDRYDWIMGFNFRKTKKILPGIKLNISKNGLGLSAGVRGARISRGATGRKTASLGLPGTGLSYRKTIKSESEISKSELSESPESKPNYTTAKMFGWAFVVLFIYEGFINISTNPFAGLMSFLISGGLGYLLTRKQNEKNR
jgi:hypothetical protein